MTSFILETTFPMSFANSIEFAKHFKLINADATKLEGNSHTKIKTFLTDTFKYTKNKHKITLLARNYHTDKPKNIAEHTHLSALLLINDVLATCDDYDNYLANFGKSCSIGNTISTVYYRRSFLNILCGQISETFYKDKDIYDEVIALSKTYSDLPSYYETYKQEIIRVSYNNITSTLNYITNKHIMVQNRTYIVKRGKKWDVVTREEEVLLSGCIGKAIAHFNISSGYVLIAAAQSYRDTYWDYIVKEFNKVAKLSISSYREVISFSFRNDQLQEMYNYYMLTANKKFNITHSLLNKNREYLIAKILRDYNNILENLPDSLITACKLKEQYKCVSELTTELILPNYY